MVRQSAGILCLAASLSWAQSPVVTQQAEVLTAPRSSVAEGLLFPFVFPLDGFDVEITISNTSQDTLGSTPQSGSCALYFYGSGAPAQNPQSTPQIPAGTQFVFRFSQGGGGITPVPNFDGYVVASCGFPLARGFANTFGTNHLGFAQDAQVITLPRSTAKPLALLYPFVINQSGYDTGIAIANTSLDPFGTKSTTGSCSLYFYGSDAPVTNPFVTPTIAPGTVYANLASSMAPGFQGYGIANCNFSNAAGFAFVSDAGARNLAFSETPQLITLPRSTASQPLLFSSVTNQNGQDTEITIANSSQDPFGTTSASGSCTMNFYGSNAPAPVTTGAIAPGTVYTSLVSQIAPGFAGYIAASCFPQAQGWAYTALSAGAGAFRVDGDSDMAELVTLPRSTSLSTSLLFSAASNWNGVDTNITISNTSEDPFGSTLGSGACTISYFGDMVNGGASPTPQVSSVVPAGGQLSFTLSQGNATQGIAGAPGFRGYVIANCGFPLARGLATITGNPPGDTVSVTVGASPSVSAITITVDGTSYAAPQTFNWISGSTHAVSATAASSGGTQYVFTNWSNGGLLSQSVTAPASNATYTANFQTQYQLTAAASPVAGGTVTPASGGFYASGTAVAINATANSGYKFTGWSGNVASSSSASTTVTMSAPQSVTASFSSGSLPSEAGVFRSTGGLGAFVLDLNQTTYGYAAGATQTWFFGLPGDQPVAGDWLGTGVVSIGVFRGGAWYFDLNNTGQYAANDGPFYFGLPGDTAIVGDWTGSGSAKVGVFRCPASGVCTWYLSTAIQTAATLTPNANLYNPATTLVYNYGLPGDQPVANNWGGAANVDWIGVFRCPAPGVGVCSWIVDNVGDGNYRTTDPVYSFGLTGDIAVVGGWNNAQRKEIGVFRSGLWILDINGSNTYASNDIQASFGLPGDKPVVGKWTQ
jgi:hypothetical protein